jgi:hypothetical protein
MVDITIFELHLDDVDVGLPWADESGLFGGDIDESDDGGGLPVVPLALVGLVAVVGVALVAWRRRSGEEA